MTEQQLAGFAAMIGKPVAEARKILAQEKRDRAVHHGHNVHDGYNYDNQEWCRCDYCRQKGVAR